MVEPLIGQELQGIAIEFVDYARWIISFLICYYAVRFFTVSDEEEDKKAEKEWRDRGEKYSEYINEKIESSKAKDHARGRHLDVVVAQSALTEALRTADEVIDAIDDHKLKVFIHKAKGLKKEVDEAMHALRLKRAKIPSAELDVTTLLGTLQVQRGDLEAKVLTAGKMPTTDAELTAHGAALKKDLNGIRAVIASVLDTVQKYVKGP